MNLGNWMRSECSVQSFACWAVEFGSSAHEGTVTFLMNMKWFLALSDAGSWVASWSERQACSFNVLTRVTAVKPFSRIEPQGLVFWKVWRLKTQVKVQARAHSP